MKSKVHRKRPRQSDVPSIAGCQESLKRPTFDEIMSFKETGDFVRFSKLLKEAYDVIGADNNNIRAQACYELALLNCQLNNHVDADFYLRRLGFRYKLNKSIWQYNQQHGGGSGPTNTMQLEFGLPDLVQCFDNAVPPQLLSRLQEVFAVDSPFWSEHQYPSDSFFSYNVPISRSTKAHGKNSKANTQTNLMKQVALYLQPLVAAAFPALDIAGGVASVEWWAHTRANGACAGHRLHYDLDEISLQEHGQLSEQIHPLVSSVLYLDDGGSSGAPTLVTNQSVLQNVSFESSEDGSEQSSGGDEGDEEADAEEEQEEEEEEEEGEGAREQERAWLCPPKTNRLLLFEGSLLHGVVPHVKSSTSTSSSEEGTTSPAVMSAEKVVSISPRVTLMIGWWGPQVAVSEAPRAQATAGGHLTLANLKPNMAMPAVVAPAALSTSTAGAGAGSTKKRRGSGSTPSLQWPALFAADESLCSEQVASNKRAKHKKEGLPTGATLSKCLVALDGDIWEEVAEGGAETRIESDMAFLGNWFLTSRTEILDAIEHSSELCRDRDRHASADAGAGAGAVEWMSLEDLKRLRGE